MAKESKQNRKKEKRKQVQDRSGSGFFPSARTFFSGRNMAIASALLFLFVIWYDVAILNFPVLAEDTHPDFSLPFLFRAGLLLASPALLFFAVKRLKKTRLKQDPIAFPRFENSFRWAALAVVYISLYIFSGDPQLFYKLGLEDHIVETASALLLLVASIGFLWLAFYLIRFSRSQRAIIAFSLLLAALFFLISMEEISWLQRVFNFETPETILGLSERDEANLHNVNTALTEILYYFGSFLFLIVIPFVNERTGMFDRLGKLKSFLPNRAVMLIAAPAFAFNYVFWNLTFTQFSFWFTLFVVMDYAWRVWTDPGQNSGREYSLALVGSFIAAQLIFMLGGDRFIRIWDATEYKELLIPVAFLAYAVTSILQIKATVVHSDEEETPPLINLKSAAVIIFSIFLLVSINRAVRNNVTYSEMDILVFAKHFADPSYIPGDYGLEQTGTPRIGFLLVLYPLTRFFSLVTVSIIGRLIGFLILSVAIGLIARRLRLDALTGIVAVGFYIWLGQDLLPDSDALFQGLEAVQYAYGFLFLSLYALLIRRLHTAGFLAGLAASLHIIAGVWGSLALGLTVLSQQMGTWRERFQSLLLWLLGASLGIFPTLAFLREEPSPLPYDAASIYVNFRNPHHFLPQNWSFDPDELLIGLALLLVVISLGFVYKQNRERTMIAQFVTWSFVPFAVGLLIAPFEIAPLFLQLGPFRVAPTLLLVFGLLLSMSLLKRYFLRESVWSWVLAVAALYFFLMAGSNFKVGLNQLIVFPKGAFQNGSQTSRMRYDICDWVRENTESDTIILTSPSRQPIYYLCERPVVVRFKSIPYGKADIPEWYSRLIAFNGGIEPEKVGFRAEDEIADNFKQLSEEQYLALAAKYGGDYLLVRSRDDLDLPLLYDNGRYALFDLRTDIDP